MRHDGERLYHLTAYSIDAWGISEYTGRRARSCDGTLLNEQLVIDYDWHGREKRWAVHAREYQFREIDADMFEMFRQISLEDRGLTNIEGREARLFAAQWLDRWEVPTPPVSDRIKQHLWIDTASLLPVRWELIDEGRPTGHGATFLEDPQLRLVPPSGLPVPTCVK